MTAPVRYFTDEHVAEAVAVALRQRGVDVRTIVGEGLLGESDEVLFAFAREQRLVIVTQDRDFLRLAAQQPDHAGVAYAPQGRPLGEMIRLLDLLAQVSDAEEMAGRIEFL